MTQNPTLGYIGTGLMGTPMAGRLLSAGNKLVVWNRTTKKAQPLVDQGAIMGESAADVARQADIVFMCLTDTKAVEAAVFGPGGIAEGASKGAILVDFSSIQPEATRQMSTRLMELTGMHWIDAPVSGGVPGAEAGTLAIMAGGDEDAFKRVEPIVLHMAARWMPAACQKPLRVVLPTANPCSCLFHAWSMRSTIRRWAMSIQCSRIWIPFVIWPDRVHRPFRLPRWPPNNSVC